MENINCNSLTGLSLESIYDLNEKIMNLSEKVGYFPIDYIDDMLKYICPDKVYVEDIIKPTLQMKINKKPILDTVKDIRNHLKCSKTLAIDGIFWCSKNAFGLKQLTITFRETNPENKEDEKHIKIIKIYKNKVDVSYHYDNYTTTGVHHRNLFNQSRDLKLQALCFSLFKVVYESFEKNK